MKIQLDYNRLAESIFALNALQMAMNCKALPIGRDELDALIRLEQDAFLQLVTGLHPQATEINAEEGSFELEGDAIIRRILETEIPNLVLAKLQFKSYPLTETIETMRKYLDSKSLPKITPCL